MPFLPSERKALLAVKGIGLQLWLVLNKWGMNL